MTDLEKPEWLKVRYRSASSVAGMRGILGQHGLHTVCDSAQCPNLGECWGEGNATMMILGDVCTRHCAFCSVVHGRPAAVDETEAERVARAVKALQLRYVVLTSVTRDDLPDGGASAFARTVQAIGEASPQTRVELLIPDLRGNWKALEQVVRARPSVIGHNIEVVRSLQRLARDPEADYRRSLSLLRQVKSFDPRMITKSSIMLGLGETFAEVVDCMRDLRIAQVDLLTLGQYLRPKGGALPVSRYVTPAEFKELKAAAESLDFAHVESGPLVRSSYRAEAAFDSIGRGR
ncbi:MAG: lipoyl synthase [Methanomassiliicoccales archaeon]|nr:lipoyl synthase [Methanomassiliicoccales archaeon]